MQGAGPVVKADIVKFSVLLKILGGKTSFWKQPSQGVLKF